MDGQMSYETFRARIARSVDALLFAMIASPVLGLAPIYLAVLGARMELGRWPVPYEDPYPFRGPVFSILWTISGALIWFSVLGPPIVLPLWRFLNPLAKFFPRLILSFVVLTLAFTLLRFDPGNILF